MSEPKEFKLIAAYDRSKNEYSLVGHNQTPEEADGYLEEWSRHLRPECSFVVVGQTKQHATKDAQNCRACRDTVARSAHIEPQPKFRRRQQ